MHKENTLICNIWNYRRSEDKCIVSYYLQKVNGQRSKDWNIKSAKIKIMKKCKGKCMMGCHNFIFDPPSLSIQEAQVGGCKTGHARMGGVWWPQACLVKIEHTTCPCLATPRMRRRRIVRRRSGRRRRPSAAFSCRSTTTPPISTSPHPWTSFLRRT
jgi:hypothetical protein